MFVYNVYSGDDLFSEHISVGALGDSFYEYLIKSWLMTSKKDVEARDMFYSCLSAIDHQLVRRTTNNVVYLTDLKNGRPDNKMQHLVSTITAAVLQRSFLWQLFRHHSP